MPDPTNVVEAMVGTSFISVEQARANLNRELPSWNFEQAERSVRAAWNEKLSRLQLEGAAEDQRAVAYTSLYHVLLYPRRFSEGGRYNSAFDDSTHRLQHA